LGLGVVRLIATMIAMRHEKAKAVTNVAEIAAFHAAEERKNLRPAYGRFVRERGFGARSLVCEWGEGLADLLVHEGRFHHLKTEHAPLVGDYVVDKDFLHHSVRLVLFEAVLKRFEDRGDLGFEHEGRDCARRFVSWFHLYAHSRGCGRWD
jgi:hypothetical protein